MRTLHVLCFVAVAAHAFVSLGADLRIPAAYSTIQAAVDAARAGDTILVAPGEYRVSAAITFRGKAITVKSEAGPAATIIRPVVGVETRLFTFESGETELSVLEGFTLTEGNAGWDSGTYECSGGAILCRGASPSVRSCMIVDNAANKGGGVAAYNSGAMPAAPVFTNCVIAWNRIYISDACCESEICISDARGANVYGEGFSGVESAAAFLTCTIVPVNVPSVYAGRYSALSFLNCILWCAGDAAVASLSSAYAPSIAYSCVKAAVVPAGDGNINEDPLLVDFRLPSSSPAVNAGIAASGVPLLDLDGNARPCWSGIDMGAFEYCGAEPPANYPLFVRGDANASGLIDIADAVFLLSYLFAQAGPPPAPFGECGLDPTPDDLECGAYAPCE